MNEELKNEIRTELTEVFRKMKEWKNIDINKTSYLPSIDEYCFPDNIYNYTIITNTGIKYIISNVNSDILDIDYDSIIYICRSYRGKSKVGHCYWDTVNGHYDNWGLFYSTTNSFNVNETIGFYED